MIEDNKLLIRKTEDLIRKSEKNYSTEYTAFLTPAEQAALMREKELAGVISFDGGYEGAERRLCRIRTEEYAPDPGCPLVLLKVCATMKDARLSHRDVLGALMGLGIKREMIGDILTGEENVWFFCMDTVVEYIEYNLEKIGRYKVRIDRGELKEIPEARTEEVRVNVSSMRLDSLCGEGFGMSRTKAAEVIRKGEVAVNWLVCENISEELKPGDRVSMKGKGKIMIGEIEGTSKKGKLFVRLVKYK